MDLTSQRELSSGAIGDGHSVSFERHPEHAITMLMVCGRCGYTITVAVALYKKSENCQWHRLTRISRGTILGPFPDYSPVITLQSINLSKFCLISVIQRKANLLTVPLRNASYYEFYSYQWINDYQYILSMFFTFIYVRWRTCWNHENFRLQFSDGFYTLWDALSTIWLILQNVCLFIWR